MKGTFIYTLSNGSTCKIIANYECEMRNENLCADGWDIPGKSKPMDSIENNLTAYVDGKKVDSSHNHNFWGVVDVDGVKKIWGLKVGFANPVDAEEYEKWIAGIIEGGKSEEVKEYEKAEEEREAEERIEEAKATMLKAEGQEDIPDSEEALRRMRQYNDFMNEGGGGYVPYVVSREEYEGALKTILEVRRAESQDPGGMEGE